MYLIERINKTSERFVKLAASERPFGPGFDANTVSTCDTLEVWGTGFLDEGNDYCLVKLFRDGKLIGERKVDGY